MNVSTGLTQASAMQRLLDDARRKLVETGTRNRLVHVNRANTRGHVLSIVNERSDDVHAILQEGRAMRFRALGQDGADGEADSGVQLSAPESGDTGAGFTDLWLETRLGPDALAKKLLKIAREARTAEEEQGVNILYLALGFVTWFEDENSGVAREAPLVLLPVELKRDERTSTHVLRLRDDDFETNLPLQQRWLDDFGLRLPDLDATTGGWSPSAYFAEVEAVIAARPHWRIEPDAMQLGFFSFAKLLMHRDLALERWPGADKGGGLAGHELTRKLLFEGFPGETPLFERDDRLDAVLPPEKLHHVVDADASQAKVIEEARAGRDLVVRGPPGTGKSQTITNIIAAAVREGRTVLFVAEKMAALSVVHTRLVKAGLRDVALELHSRTANKRAVMAELARTLAAADVREDAPPPDALRAARDRLNGIADLLHAPIGLTGETPFTAMGRQAQLIGRNVPPPTLKADALDTMTRLQERDALVLIADLGAKLKAAGPPGEHPLNGVGILGLSPVDVERLRGELPRTAAAAAAMDAAMEAAIAATGAHTPRSFAAAAAMLDRLGRAGGLDVGDRSLAASLMACPDLQRCLAALEAAVGWCDARTNAEADFMEAAFTADAAGLRGPLAAGANSFLARLGGGYRAASTTLAGWLSKPLPGKAHDRLALLDRLLKVQQLRRAWRDEEAFLTQALGDAWRGERTDFARALKVARWCAAVRAGASPGDDGLMVELAGDPGRARALAEALRAAQADAPLVSAAVAALQLHTTYLGGAWDAVEAGALAALLHRVAGGLPRHGEWAALHCACAALAATGLQALARAMMDGAMTAAAAADELRFARAERLWALAVSAEPKLANLRHEDRHVLAANFAATDTRRFAENAAAIVGGHRAQLPRGAEGEMRVLRGEMGKKRALMPLRKLITKAPNAIQRIKPVLLMSPISVAQFLPPGTLTFDLLVIDEASQVRPEEALGAIARARQVVVVGDEKQLPPTSFFDRVASDGGDDDQWTEDEPEEDLLGGAARVDESESILTLCQARGLPARQLLWHYRSRDPSLMRVSNAEFYEDALILPPSPLERDRSYGLVFMRVEGSYDRGGRRDNRLEGEALVRRVAEHARRTPDVSLGIVTFSHAQKNLLTELLEKARRTDPALDALLREGKREDVFVKNIENVQGDERDVILISIGYGPSTPGGPMRIGAFPVVNREGGERRLNVLFTRARLRCEVFASFDPADLDVTSARHDGPRILKRFLDYAKSGQLEAPASTGREADSPFEEDVAAVIRSLGFLADPQVGSAGFRIDIGVRHPDKPGAYLLAVECDGAAYHSALWARERDRLRQELLERLGWRFHRIWSTDWFYDRRGQIARLQAALGEALTRAQAGGAVDVEGANGGAAAIEPEAEPFTAEPIPAPAPPPPAAPAYVRASVQGPAGFEPHAAPMSILVPMVRTVVEVEGPVHMVEVARRVAAAFGKKSAGGRIVAATEAALRQARRGADGLRQEGEFWFTAAQHADPPVRDRSAEPQQTCSIEAVSRLEIRAALALAAADNAGGDPEELARAAARLLGFQRFGSEIAARFRHCGVPE